MIPKRLHLYWGKNKPLSFLRSLTVDSFKTLNPDWQVMVWVPTKPSQSIAWTSNEHSITNEDNTDYLEKLEVTEFDFESIGISEDWPEVHKSDLLRWYLLGEIGGVWSDFDILYVQKITDVLADQWKGVGLCHYECIPDDPRLFHAIGFLTSEGAIGRTFFRQLFNFGLSIAPQEGYQTFGAHLIEAFLKYCWYGPAVFFHDADLVYPYRNNWDFLKYFINHDMEKPRDTIGLHWYGGNPECNKGELEINPLNYQSSEMLICKEARNVLHKKHYKIFYDKPKDIKNIKYTFAMPYLKRSEQLKSTLQSLAYFYRNRNDFEIIVARDVKNSKTPDEDEKLYKLIKLFDPMMPIKIIDYGSEDTYNPSKAFNLCAKESSGKYLIVTNPECVHRADILSGLDDEFARNKDAYVICSCFSIGESTLAPVQSIPNGFWYQHSKHRNVECHFCSALSLDTYFKIGGFDENYSHGMGFDDDDFRNSLKKYHVPFVLRDDLLTVHLSHNGSLPKDYLGLHEINKKYYDGKWGREMGRAEKMPLSKAKTSCTI